MPEARGELSGWLLEVLCGPLLPNPLVRRGVLPLFPSTERLAFQGVHSDDVAQAYTLAVLNERASGAYNVAAEPVLQGEGLAEMLGARPVKIPAAALRAAAGVTWRLRLQPTDPSWVDLALQSPLMDSSRARNELGWAPRHTAGQALAELLGGLHDGAGADTPPLDPVAGGRARLRELLSGVGGSQG